MVIFWVGRDEPGYTELKPEIGRAIRNLRRKGYRAEEYPGTWQGLRSANRASSFLGPWAGSHGMCNPNYSYCWMLTLSGHRHHYIAKVPGSPSPPSPWIRNSWLPLTEAAFKVLYAYHCYGPNWGAGDLDKVLDVYSKATQLPKEKNKLCPVTDQPNPGTCRAPWDYIDGIWEFERQFT